MVMDIILVLVIIALAIALFFQVKAAKEQSEEAAVLLKDYQRRVDEQQKLLDDYHALEKNFDGVGKGYEQALLAFDKMQEDKEVMTQVKEALEKQVRELTEANSRLQAELKKAGGAA